MPWTVDVREVVCYSDAPHLKNSFINIHFIFDFIDDFLLLRLARQLRRFGAKQSPELTRSTGLSLTARSRAPAAGHAPPMTGHTTNRLMTYHAITRMSTSTVRPSLISLIRNLSRNIFSNINFTLSHLSILINIYG